MINILVRLDGTARVHTLPPQTTLTLLMLRVRGGGWRAVPDFPSRGQISFTGCSGCCPPKCFRYVQQIQTPDGPARVWWEYKP